MGGKPKMFIGGVPTPYQPHKAATRKKIGDANKRRRLLAACDRLLKTEVDIKAMDDFPVQRDWLLRRPGHRDAFTVARALKELLG